MRILFIFNIAALALYAWFAACNIAAVTARPRSGFHQELSSQYAVQWVKDTIPTMDEMWRSLLQNIGKKTATLANNLISEAKKDYADVVVKIDEFKVHMDNMVATSAAMGISIDKRLSAHGMSRDELSEMLSDELEPLVEALLAEFQEPLPEDQDERYKRREEMLGFALNKIEEAVVKVCVSLDIPEDEARRNFAPVRATVHSTLSIAGNIIDRHPDLIKALIITSVCLMLPQSWFLEPILRLLGFGMRGPVKGSAAALLQRMFFGGEVTSGSWFAVLQRAGMVGVGWLWRLAAALAAALAIVAGRRP